MTASRMLNQRDRLAVTLFAICRTIPAFRRTRTDNWDTDG